jgi:hypothetical protein
MDDVKNGQRINCNGVRDTVIAKRSTRNQRFVFAKMDNGFTLKLNADTLSLELPKSGAIAQLKSPTEQLASVDWRLRLCALVRGDREILSVMHDCATAPGSLAAVCRLARLAALAQAVG